MQGGFSVGRARRRPGARAATAIARRVAVLSPRLGALGLCGLAALACSGEHIIVAEERGGEAGSSGSPDVNPSDIVPPSGVPLLEDCPPSPAQRTELLGCWPTRHVGDWRGLFIGVPRYPTLDGTSAEMPSGELHLHVGLDGSGSLSFGSAEPSAVADPCAGAPALEACPALGRLLPGFDYRLEDVQLFDAPVPAAPAGAEDGPRSADDATVLGGERMSISIRLGEPWQAHCAALQPEPVGSCPGGVCTKAATPPTERDAEEGALCSCTAAGCSLRAPSLQLSLRMSIDGLALAGTYRADQGPLVPARVEFLREPEP